MVAPVNITLKVKLKPRLFDLSQHCELKCRADCCRWDAFDFSEHWLQRWCESRNADEIAAALTEITRLREHLSGRDPETLIGIQHFFCPSVQSLVDRLSDIEAVLAAYSLRTSGQQ